MLLIQQNLAELGKSLADCFRGFIFLSEMGCMLFKCYGLSRNPTLFALGHRLTKAPRQAHLQNNDNYRQLFVF